MAAAGKKKGKKGVTLPLTTFLSGEAGSAGGGGSYSTTSSSHGYASRNWAEEVEAQDEGDSSCYGTALKPVIDRSQLPTAPRAARDPDIDLNRIPSAPPYKAYLGNLPYDITPYDVERFFSNLKVIDVSLPQNEGRQKGFGYAEFEDRQSLVEALSMTDETLNNRKIRVDLAQTQDRDGYRRRDDGDDRSSGDWRKKDDRPAFDSRRDDDRGFDRRDRFDDRDRYGHDWHSDRYSGYGRDKYRDSYDTYSGRDRGYFRGDRDRFDDRRRYDDRGFGDRDGGRRFGSGFRDGDRSRYEPPRDRGFDRGFRDDRPRYQNERRDDFDLEREPSHDSAKERPKLNLQKRSKPIEEAGKPSERSSSIFGNAKPVDTAAREREIEERLLRQREMEYRQVEEEKENRDRMSSVNSQRSRRESSGSQDGVPVRRERKLSSSSSGKGIRTVAPPPGVGSARIRRDSALSDEEEVFNEDSRSTSSPVTPSPPKPKEEKILVPAPPPKENIWEKRKTGGSPSSNAAPQQSDTSRESDEQQEPASEYSTKQDEKELLTSDEMQPKAKGQVAAEAPKENVWEKRKQDKKGDSPPNRDGSHGTSWGDKHKEGGIRESTGASRGWGGERGRGGGRGRGADRGGKREKREKHVPKSLDEMPKYEEAKAKDFSDANKFSYLMDEEGENGTVSD